jgi:hypothetical protein
LQDIGGHQQEEANDGRDQELDGEDGHAHIL